VRGKWAWPSTHTDLEFRGTAPVDLDGVFVLPELVSDSGESVLLHALRIGHGQPVWYTVLSSLSELELIGRFGAGFDSARERLSTTAHGASALSWQLADSKGEVVETGTVAMDHPNRLAGVALTPRHLVLVAHHSESDAGPVPALASYQVGIAARDVRARVRWLVTAPGCPLLLHACEVGPEIIVDIARSKVADTRSASLLRWTLTAQSDEASVEYVNQLCVDWPTVHAPPESGPYRYLYAVARECTGSDGPALIRFDQTSGHTVKRHLGFGREVGAPTLLPLAPQAERHERALLFAVVYDAVRDASELLILDAADLDGRPLASIRLPTPVRSNLPGRWLRASNGHTTKP